MKVEELDLITHCEAHLIPGPLSPELAKLIGFELAIGGAGVSVVIDWASPDWLEMTHRVWSQGGVPG